METQTWRTDQWAQWGRRGRDELRRGPETHITVSAAASQREFRVCGRDVQTPYSTRRCFVTNQRAEMRWEMGGRLRREGTRVYPELINADAWQKPAQHCKRNYPLIKNK